MLVYWESTDAQNKHLVSDPTQLASTSQGDSGQLSINSGPCMASAWPAFTNGRAARAAVSLRRGVNDGTHHRSLPAPQAEGRFGLPFTRQTIRQLLGSRTLHAAYTRRDTEHKKSPRTFLSAVGGTASNPTL